MKKLQVISIIVLILSTAGLMIWRFVVPFPDWLVRVVGVLSLVSIFTTVFSIVKISAAKKQASIALIGPYSSLRFGV